MALENLRHTLADRSRRRKLATAQAAIMHSAAIHAASCSNCAAAVEDV